MIYLYFVTGVMIILMFCFFLVLYAKVVTIDNLFSLRIMQTRLEMMKETVEEIRKSTK